MTSDAWQDFGYAIRQARIDLGWSLERLATEALGNGARKGYVSQVEKGRRNLSPETIDKFDQALTLPADIVKAAHLAPPPNAEVDKAGKPKSPALAKPIEDVDRDAERLLTRIDRDQSNPQVAEALLTTLAYEFAGGEFRDLQTAYVALRKALEAAEAMRKRGEMPVGNTGMQLNAVMAEVAKLNDQGELDQADALLEAEEKRMRADHVALAEQMTEARRQMLEQRLNQDRLRNDPKAAATRLIVDLLQQPNHGKMFWAINNLCDEWRDSGDQTGDIFALRVAIQIARANWEKYKHKRDLEAAALHSLGWGYFQLARRSTRQRDLQLSHNALKKARDLTSKTKKPSNWANRQSGFGAVLREMGEREENTDLLRQCVAAHREALKVATSNGNTKNFWNNLGFSLQKLGEITQNPAPLSEAITALNTSLSAKNKTADPLDWEMTQNNLALAQRWQGALIGDRSLLLQARAGYQACEDLEIRDEAEFRWARLQWNIADLTLARFALDPGVALLDEADTHVHAAREVFVVGSDYQTERCDTLIAQIKAARATL